MPSSNTHPFKAFLPGRVASETASLPPDCYVLHDPRAEVPSGATIDGLDRFLLSCIKGQVLLCELFERLPCSRAEVTARVKRLVQYGVLSIRQEEGIASAVQKSVIPEEDVSECDTIRPSPSRSIPSRST